MRAAMPVPQIRLREREPSAIAVRLVLEFVGKPTPSVVGLSGTRCWSSIWLAGYRARSRRMRQAGAYPIVTLLRITQ
jgi:hypothetical protein